LFDFYVDNDDLTLNKIKSKIESSIKYINTKIKNTKIKDFNYLKEKRKLEGLLYHKKFLTKILENRNKKY
jgi:hypothetical protein